MSYVYKSHNIFQSCDQDAFVMIACGWRIVVKSESNVFFCTVVLYTDQAHTVSVEHNASRFLFHPFHFPLESSGCLNSRDFPVDCVYKTLLWHLDFSFNHSLSLNRRRLASCCWFRRSRLWIICSRSVQSERAPAAVKSPAIVSILHNHAALVGRSFCWTRFHGPCNYRLRKRWRMAGVAVQQKTKCQENRSCVSHLLLWQTVIRPNNARDWY